MKIWKIPRRTHTAREQTHDIASGSVNTDAPELGLEVLKVIDRQLAPYGLEVEIFDNGSDALIWKLTGRVSARVTKPEPQPVERPSTEVTSPEVASQAAIVMRMSDDAIIRYVNSSEEFRRSIRSIAASALTQREKEEEKDD